MPADIAEVLERFPGQVVLRHSRKLKLALLCYALCMYALAAYPVIGMISSDDPALQRGGLTFGILAGLTFMILIAFLRDAWSLTLDGDGFEHRIGFYRRRRTWTEVSDFSVDVARVGARKIAFVSYSDSRPKSWLDSFRGRIIRSANGIESTYGFSHAELAGLLNGWRSRALARQDGRPHED